MCCDASIVVSVFNSCPLCFLFYKLCCDASSLVTFNSCPFCFTRLRVASGPRVKLASCKSTLNLPVVCSTDRSKAVVPVLVLLFCCFVVYSTRRFFVCLFVCHFVLVFFSPYSIAITLWKGSANLVAFRTFVRFGLVWICRFPLPLGVWEGLRFVIATLPGLFSYPFL